MKSILFHRLPGTCPKYFSKIILSIFLYGLLVFFAFAGLVFSLHRNRKVSVDLLSQLSFTFQETTLKLSSN